MTTSNIPQTPSKARKPVVLMTTGHRTYSEIDYQLLGEKYIRPIFEQSQCIPLMMPTAFSIQDVEQYLSMVDGVFVSGASTNIDPSLYGQAWQTPDLPQDKDRDQVDLVVIRRALELGLPLLGVCRGFQEMNVAFGGDLHQKVHDLPGMLDHTDPKGPNGEELPLDVMYGPNHPVQVVPDTWFAKLMGQDTLMVNSLHGQGIKTLASKLTPLAHAPDGLIEAVYFNHVPQFTLGVQWHPEWKTWENPLWVKMFAAFGDACATFKAQRNA